MITHPDAEDNDTRGVSLRGNGEASRSFLPDEDRYRFYPLLQAGFAVVN